MDDVFAACEWLRAETGSTPALWGLRAGGLLAAQAIREMAPAPDLLLWQPVVSGKQYLQQFLRMKVTGQWAGGEGADRIGTRELREELGNGESVDVAGYTLASALALGMEAAEILPPAAPTRVAWLEVAGGDRTELSPAAGQQVDRWRAAGHHVDVRVVSGLPFWQTQEIAECPDLIEATLQAVTQWNR
jgi:exosortase A-associated hydrolase 2